MPKLSIIIPVYNERNTILEILNRIEAVNLGEINKEIIIVDDFSTDGTREILKGLENKYLIFYQDKNYGKGACMRKGYELASGDYIISQDADLEYDPQDYQLLLEPFLKGKADVVYGSRLMTCKPHRVFLIRHHLANRFLTTLSNFLTGLTLTDMETGYKMFRQEAIKTILPKLKANRFGIEPELTSYVGRGRYIVYEVGISYYGRSYVEGKKINWRDGLAAIWHIIKFNLFR